MKRGCAGKIGKVFTKYLFEKDPKKIRRNATMGFVATPVPVVGTVYAVWCGVYHVYRKFIDNSARCERIKEGKLAEIAEDTENL